MKPPEKIVLTHYDLQWLSVTHQRFDPCSQRYEETFVGNTFEYHLAPVWHDAKEPPEEGERVEIWMVNKYIVIATYYEYYWKNDGGGTISIENVLKWKPLPQPPESEGE